MQKLLLFLYHGKAVSPEVKWKYQYLLMSTRDPKKNRFLPLVFTFAVISAELPFLHKTSSLEQNSAKQSHQPELPVCMLKKSHCSFWPLLGKLLSFFILSFPLNVCKYCSRKLRAVLSTPDANKLWEAAIHLHLFHLFKIPAHKAKVLEHIISDILMSV